MKLLFAGTILLAQTSLAQIDVFFSPNGGCTEAVVQNLQYATNFVYVLACSLTSAPTAKALVEAKNGE